MKTRGFCCVGLDRAKDPANVGGALRAAYCFGAAMVAVSGKRFERAGTDVFATYRHLPLLRCEELRAVVPFDCVPVAVDLVEGATPLGAYAHPDRAFYVFGAEDATLGKRSIAWCRDVVFVPTRGCLNLAATVNVVLYDRAAKRNEWPRAVAEDAL